MGWYIPKVSRGWDQYGRGTQALFIPGVQFRIREEFAAACLSTGLGRYAFRVEDLSKTERGVERPSM